MKLNSKTTTLALACLAAFPSLSQAAITVTTAKGAATSADGTPSPFFASSTDLGQTAFSSTDRLGLFNGNAGTTSSGTNNNPATTLNAADTVTITFDITTNTLGYDITGITSIFGWNSASNGRSNQGYSVDLGFVGGATATLANGTHWEPNSPANYWTQVSFANSGGGTLASDTIDLNGGGAAAGTGVTATGVESITFTISQGANSGGGVIVAREFDVFGVATIPEPSTALLGSLGVLGLLRRRR
jgi:hypothetical protein